jgi:hypothetical protein
MEESPVPKPTWGHPEFINYFRQDLAGSVESDIRPLLAKRGAFGVPRQFFPYVEYLAGLVFGPVSGKDLGSTAHAERFLTQYMTGDPLYGAQAWLLLNMGGTAPSTPTSRRRLRTRSAAAASAG